MEIAQGNLFSAFDPTATEEQTQPLLTAPDTRIERIVSTGHASPPGFWYDQEWDEFVLLVSGSAALRIEAEAMPRRLGPGDHLLIPAHVRHRVEWTSVAPPAIWLAVHCRPVTSPSS